MRHYDVAVIGAGIAGLAAAFRLTKMGKKVLVVEKDDRIGGLLSCYESDGFDIERYYHHFFRHDAHLLALIRELGIAKEVMWRTGSVGYYINGIEHPLNTPIDFLLYKYLSTAGKARLIRALAGLRFIKDLSFLDDCTAKEWIFKQCGQDAYYNFFKPLLDAKFGRFSDSISAAWLCARVKVRSHHTVTGEVLGYFRNSFSVLFKALRCAIEKTGTVQLNSKVDKIILESDAVKALEIQDRIIEVQTVISTVSIRRLKRLCGFSGDIAGKMDSFREQAVNCALFVLRREIGRNYWVNIKNENSSFHVMVNHTRLWGMPSYGDRHLLYVVSYDDCETEEEFYSKSDGQILNQYKKSLKDLFGLDEKDLVSSRLSRSFDGGPVYTVGFLKNMIPFRSYPRNLFMSGMAQSYPDRGINDSVFQGMKCAQTIINEQDV